MITQNQLTALAVQKFGEDAFDKNAWLFKVYTTAEVWEYIGGCDYPYFVSNTGKVRNNKGKILKTEIKKCKREYIRLIVNGKQKHFLIYRLVADAFIPNPENKKEVNHDNLDFTLNHAYNLTWMNPAENKQHYWQSEKAKTWIEGLKGRAKKSYKKYIIDLINTLPPETLAKDIIKLLP